MNDQNENEHQNEHLQDDRLMKVLLLILFVPFCVGFRRKGEPDGVHAWTRCDLCTYAMFNIGQDLKEGGAHATVDKTVCEREHLWEDSIYITTEEHSKYCYRIMERVLSDRALTAKIRDLFVPRYTTLPSGMPVIVNDFTDAYAQICLDKYGVQECAEEMLTQIVTSMLIIASVYGSEETEDNSELQSSKVVEAKGEVGGARKVYSVANVGGPNMSATFAENRF
ncbi:hypothetical protein OESDEN_11424 [Oesophagostomum dentatum]|uniref:Saposin B-type domain-containing protein n=1 Tax=Oesophagostomum dentatum TaxID=61180 RepID=A0A0B1STY8_OESDE|nr:hypothetical protein OESDEN_11424 [Oesophagostomum dentatum]